MRGLAATAGSLPEAAELGEALRAIFGEPAAIEVEAVDVVAVDRALTELDRMGVGVELVTRGGGWLQVYADSAVVAATSAAVAGVDVPRAILPRRATQAEAGVVTAVAAELAAGVEPFRAAGLRVSRAGVSAAALLEDPGCPALNWVEAKLRVGDVWGRALVIGPAGQELAGSRRSAGASGLGRLSRRLEGMVVPSGLESAPLRLSVAEVGALEVGDVVVVAPPASFRGVFRLGLGRGFFTCDPIEPEESPIGRSELGRTWRVSGGFVMSDSHRVDASHQPAPSQEGPKTGRSDLLEQMEVDVVIELGRVGLPAAEVVRMGPGSVIELDRPVGTTADLKAGGRLVARGELVDVEGRLGLRITEMVD